MKEGHLKAVRLQKGWSEAEAAARLGVSQPYVSMLEAGQRRLTPTLARKVRRAYALSPVVLPATEVRQQVRPATLTKELAALGYPGFAYLRGKQKRNPAEVLLTALNQGELEARLVEALPWLVLHYWDMDTGWLVSQAKLRNLQNRLGFVVDLARQVADRVKPAVVDRAEKLKQLEAELNESRLVREDTLGKSHLGTAEKEWLLKNRPPQARHWNLLTNLQVDMLRYPNRA